MGWGLPGQPQGTSLSVLLNVSYHKKLECLWFRGGEWGSERFLRY